MKLTIDNLDGLGAMDYSGAIDAHEAFKIERVLNAPSIAKGMLCLAGSTLAQPVRRGRMVVSLDAGAILFTGYLATEPVPVYAGMASEGPVYRLAFSAVSDEWMLDKQSAGTRPGASLATFGGPVLKALTSRLDASRFVTTGVTDGRAIGVFEPQVDAVWSGHAGAVADATYASYRVLNGTVSMSSAGSVVHALGSFEGGDGGVSQIAGLRAAAVRELANDVTLSGEMEPSVFWTEIFLGDGTTAEFALLGDPTAPNTGKAVLIHDDFKGALIDGAIWAITDPGSHLGLSSKGLTLSGGNGFDGQTTLLAYDAVELGGTNVVELGDVVLGAASAGVLGGLYTGATAQANCLAGFNVRQAGGQTLIAPMVNGLELKSGGGSGPSTTFSLLDGHRYTLRIRLHCAEMQRVKQTYYANVGGVITQFGGGLVDAPLSLVFEVRDQGSSSNTPMTVLYDGAVLVPPARVSFVAVNSLQMFGSVGSVRVIRTGSASVKSTDPQTGAVRTRLIGRASEGVDCAVHSSVTETVTFFAGRVPVVGEIVTVTYRGRRRSVARLADTASLAAEAAGGGAGTARWVGRVVRPVARSSEDCENAAQAILGFSSDRAAAVAGSYVAVNPGAGAGSDIWPGDALVLTANGRSTSVLVRRVAVEERGASPEALLYRIEFANDWAEGLGIQVSAAFAKDALFPPIALGLPVGSGAAHVLANLQQMTVIGMTGAGSSAAMAVDAGVDAPAGGGFEVRRRDGGFGTGFASGSGGSGELVLRSPVRGFSIPRATIEEQFFIRMYDGSAVPLYSRESSAIATHVPLG